VLQSDKQENQKQTVWIQASSEVPQKP